jgi:putative nucleotidyltransferase with HDIG domain
MAAHTHALLGPQQGGYGLLPGALWTHSVAVALACQLIAGRHDRQQRGLLFTVGLLHDIGKIVLNEYVAAEYAEIVRVVRQEQLTFLEAERRVLGVTHAEVGEEVAKRWELPDPIPVCIRYHHEPAELPTPDPTVDIVHLADAVCLLMGIGGGDDSQLYRVDAAARARAGLKEEEFEKIGATIVAELKSVQRSFGIG